MKIVIGNDHGALELKNRIAAFLKVKGYSICDMGVNSDDSVDYPDIALKTCLEYKSGDYDLGILLCGTGIGISIAANKIKGIRCALIHDLFTAEMAKMHNNANFIAFGGRIKYSVKTEEMITKFIETEFGGDRHRKRVSKIMKLDSAK